MSDKNKNNYSTEKIKNDQKFLSYNLLKQMIIKSDITKSIIEEMNSELWYETLSGSGKIFFENNLKFIGHIKNGMLESVEEHTRLIFEDHSHRLAEEWEDAIVSRLHHEFISDGRALYLMKEAEKKKLYSELIEAINEELESHCNRSGEDWLDDTSFKRILNYRKILHVKFNKENLVRAAARNEIDVIDADTRRSEKQEISLSFIEALDTEFNRRYEQIVNAEKKQVDALNSSLAFGDVSDRKPLEHIYSGFTYSMMTLSRLMISEQYGNYFEKFLGT